MPVAAAEFVTLCRRVDHEDLVGFVAALFEARGRTVDRPEPGSGADLRLDGSRAVLVGRDRPAAVPEAVDVVVVADTDQEELAGVRTHGVADLHEWLLYAVDRDAAETLLAAHLGADPDLLPGPAAGTDAVDDHGSGPVLVGTVVVAAVAVVGLVVGLAVLGTGGTPPVDGAAGTPVAAETPGDGTGPTAAAREQLNRSIAASDPTAARAIRSADTPPPGLSWSGGFDAGELGRAHASVMRERPYRLVLTYSELDGTNATGTYTETVRVANATRYVTTRTVSGRLRTGPHRVTDGVSYADGSRRLVRDGSEARLARLSERDRFATDAERLVRWSLSTENVSVDARDDEGFRYVIRASDDPYPGVTNATARAVVTPAGLVESLRWTYTDNGGRVRTTLRVEPGPVTVQRPAWANQSSAAVGSSTLGRDTSRSRSSPSMS